jgi:superfamily II DNA or RNA helicase
VGSTLSLRLNGNVSKLADKLHIEKVNEVYNKVKTDDRGIAEELSAYFTFKVPGYQFMPAYRNKFWDGQIRLYNTATQMLYSGLNNYVIMFAKERGYEVEFEYDNSADNYSVAEAKKFVEEEKFTMVPRDYQLEAYVDAIRYKRGLFISPTASGKSFIIYMIMRKLLRQTLIIVPTTTLVHQMYSDFEEYGFNSEKYCHKIFSGKDKNTDKPVVITTWQSIYKLRKDWFKKFDVVIGDEAHLFKAKSLTSILEKMEDTEYRFGFTGTLDGTQTHKLVLEGLFGPAQKVISTKELMDSGTLADFKIKILALKYHDEIRKIVSKMDYQAEMDFLVSHEGRNKFIKNLALSLNGNTLLLFQYVDKHGRILEEMIKEEAGDRKVFFIHGGVKGEERDDIRGIVEKENNAIIVASYGTFSTGVNIKNLHSIIFASPSKSKIRNLQSIGRGLRKSDTKDSATLYDIADDLSWKSTSNFTLKHLMERVKIYDEEKFDYKLYSIGLN